MVKIQIETNTVFMKSLLLLKVNLKHTPYVNIGVHLDVHLGQYR